MLYSILDGKDYISYIKGKYIYIEDVKRGCTLIVDINLCRVVYSYKYTGSRIALLLDFVVCNKKLFGSCSGSGFREDKLKNVLQMNGFLVQIDEGQSFISYIVKWCNNTVRFFILSDGSLCPIGVVPDSILGVLRANISFFEHYWILRFNHILYKDRGVSNVRICGNM